MIGKIYKSAFSVIAKKPLRLFGTSILFSIIVGAVWLLSGFVPIIAICLTAILSVGMSMVYLHGYRGEQVEPFQLFDGFKTGKTAGRTVKGILYRDLLLILWGLLILVPTVVFAPLMAIHPVAAWIFGILLFLCMIAVCILVIFRSYQYSLTPFILVEEEDGNPFEAYKESTQRTKGYCGQMFLADLIPAIAVLVVSGVFALITWGFSAISYKVGIVFGGLFGIILLVIEIVLPLFYGLVHAAFYEELTAIYNNKGAIPAGYQGYPQGGYQGYPQGGYQQPQYPDGALGYQQPQQPQYPDPNTAYQQPPYQG